GSGKKILFLVSYTPPDLSNPIYNRLCELIEDLAVMGNHCSNLKNKEKLSGRMSGVGFQGGYEDGKTAGTYATQKNLPPAQQALDDIFQQKLASHNELVKECIRHFSPDAHEQKRKALEDFSIPSWSNKEWESSKNNPEPVASNVIVTSNDFSNKPHCEKDKNVFTYGIFSYINRKTGSPILPPSNEFGHALRFPDYDCNIEFGRLPGIVEVFWKSNDISHHTVGPPAELKILKIQPTMDAHSKLAIH
ncbi:hypothetical protein PtA15_15A491, partial [Puccinia triticina]